MSARQEWLTERRRGVGASEAAALFGLHPYISELSLYAAKTLPPVEDDESNERAEDGKIIEPRIAARYAKATGRHVMKPERMLYESADHPNMLCSPDRITMFADLDKHGPLELKWWDNYHAGDEIPTYGQIQLQQQMAVLGAERGSIAILGSFRSFHHFDIERNDAFIEILIQKIDEFWDRVTSRTAPDADGSEATAQALKRLYPRDNGSTVALDGQCAMWAEQLEKAKADIKAAKALEEEAHHKLCGAIGENTFGTLPGGGGFSYKLQSRKEFVTAASEFRVLRKTK